MLILGRDFGSWKFLSTHLSLPLCGVTGRGSMGSHPTWPPWFGIGKLRVFDLKRLKIFSLHYVSYFSVSFCIFLSLVALEKKQRCVLWVVSVHELTVLGSRQRGCWGPSGLCSEGFGQSGLVLCWRSTCGVGNLATIAFGMKPWRWNLMVLLWSQASSEIRKHNSIAVRNASFTLPDVQLSEHKGAPACFHTSNLNRLTGNFIHTGFLAWYHHCGEMLLYEACHVWIA